MTTGYSVPIYIDYLSNVPAITEPIFNAIVLYRFDMRIKREINQIIKGLLKRLGLESIYSSAIASSPDTQKTPLGLAKNIQPQSPNLNHVLVLNPMNSTMRREAQDKSTVIIN